MTSYRCGGCDRVFTHQELEEFAEERRGVMGDTGWRCPRCFGRTFFKVREPAVRRVRAV